MPAAKFSIDEIDVGDAIMFDDKHRDSYGCYWTVLSKTQNQITVEIRRSLVEEAYTVYITEVTHLEKRSVNS